MKNYKFVLLITIFILGSACIRKYGDLTINNKEYKGGLCIIVDRTLAAKQKKSLLGSRVSYGNEVVIENLHIGYHSVKVSFPIEDKSNHVNQLVAGDSCLFDAARYAEYEVYITGKTDNKLAIKLKDIISR